MRFYCFCLLVLLTSTVFASPGDPKSDRVDFNRDVRPILARKCFACHGPDDGKREAGLRLDQRESATARLESGETAVVPQKPEASEILRRVVGDEFTRMPPVDAGEPLTKDQVETLRRWISQGAPYARHWSFVKPVSPAIPPNERTAEDASTVVPAQNPVDNFIRARLRDEGLKPSSSADRYALVRRLSLDLRGLPPTPAEVKAFVADESPDAYDRLVDRFLTDPAFGERWARKWLDLARYADSRGYGSDPLRPNIWRYRDWVIDALNRNAPFDEFTIEQHAGDLLPDATIEQKVATAFHRNTMTNVEGGTDDEEFRVAAVRDRVDTTMQVWMGLTMGCAKCHNHKYDPVSQQEYYQFYDFFNQTADSDKGDESPVMNAPSRSYLAEVARINARIAELSRKLESPPLELAAEIAAAQANWEVPFRDMNNDQIRGRYVRIELPGKQKILSLAEVQVSSGGKNAAAEGKPSQSSEAFAGPPRLAIDGNTNGDYTAKSTTHTKTEDNPWWEVDLGSVKPIGGVTVWNRTDNNLHTRLANFRVLVLNDERQPVAQKDVAPAPNPKADVLLDGPRATVSPEVLAVIDTPVEKRSDAQRERLAAHYLTRAPALKPIRDEIAKLEKSKPAPPTVPVMQELPDGKHRETHIMVRGNFLQNGETVSAKVPAAFHEWRASLPNDRLGVARWLIDRDNPLTARVAVNRVWSQLFGAGLIETEEDFGTQGEPPTHPELLNWLAVDFMRDWDRKRLIRTLVTSATYRQSSRATEDLRKRDPRNRLLARGPRFRLDAEMVRDQALAISGLLNRELGGPSVYPPQPKGLWRAAFNGERTWPTSKGRHRHRRGLYTFWRRTTPYPSMAVFDAPSREICNVRRIRTNTPLQAFVTLNDPAYVEAAQSLARRIVREGGKSPGERVRYALELCLSRPASDGQVQTLVELYESELAHYQKDVEAAKTFATDPLGPLPEDGTAAEFAAWTVVANVLLNLDGVLMKG